ncbi:14119_t:CDS:2, partial [Racocetra persica]
MYSDYSEKPSFSPTNSSNKKIVWWVEKERKPKTDDIGVSRDYLEKLRDLSVSFYDLTITVGWDDVFKTIGSVALAASYFTPIGPVTGAITAGALAYGGTVEIIGHATDDEDIKKVGRFVWTMAKDAAIDGIAGAKVGCEAWSKAEAETYRAAGKPYIPTPDPKDTIFFAKNAKFFAK